MMIALRVAEQQILRLSECPPDEILAAKMAAQESVEVCAFNPETKADELFEVVNLHHATDGWGVDHLVGEMLGEVRQRYGQPYELSFLPVVFIDNEFEADPLSLH